MGRRIADIGGRELDGEKKTGKGCKSKRVKKGKEWKKRKCVALDRKSPP
jgi:hypothetical protein